MPGLSWVGVLVPLKIGRVEAQIHVKTFEARSPSDAGTSYGIGQCAPAQRLGPYNRPPSRPPRDMELLGVGNSGSQKTSSAIKRNPENFIGSVDWILPSVTDWRRVIFFSDESRFSLSDDDHRTRTLTAEYGRYFNADCDIAQVPFINRIMLVHILFPTMSSGYYVLPWPARIFLMSMSGRWEATAAVPRYRRINCGMQRLWIFPGGHK
ncbi:hypothetical protein TNCV_33741 [Trichonephila clavipes]|nr:hypothetical protein TNCV_33741 [Trichonephila clavipes]